MNGFGECPECGKIGLVIVERGEDPIRKWKYIKVKCIHCGYYDTIYL